MPVQKRGLALAYKPDTKGADLIRGITAHPSGGFQPSNPVKRIVAAFPWAATCRELKILGRS